MDTCYCKINSLWKRDLKGKVLQGEFSLPEFEYLQDNEWIWTEKIDGTNIRLIWDGTTVTFGGRTDNAQIPAKLVSHLREHWGDPELWDAAFPNASPDAPVAVYGEGYGAGIQKAGILYRADQGFIAFDVRVGPWWLSREGLQDVAGKIHCGVVPVVMRGDTNDAEVWVAEPHAIEGVEFSAPLPEKVEGLVGVPAVPLFARNGDRIIVKIKRADL